jgi:hypothetical protein
MHEENGDTGHESQRPKSARHNKTAQLRYAHSTNNQLHENARIWISKIYMTKVTQLLTSGVHLQDSQLRPFNYRRQNMEIHENIGNVFVWNNEHVHQYTKIK